MVQPPDTNRRLTHIKKIAVIGAGPTGVACAKYLQAEKAFESIDVYEQRDNVGGIWNLSEAQASKGIPIPQTNPNLGQRQSVGGWDESGLEFESPLYDYLETNIPKPLMAYSDAPFAPELPLFPKHDQVLRYLEEYAEPVRKLIRFKSQVTHLSLTEPHDDGKAGAWTLSSRDLNTQQDTTTDYDAVIIANGHYTVPHVPAITGLREWNQTYPGVVIHSKAYRKPEDFRSQRVLVIGNSASGMDIAAQISAYASHPVYLASRSASIFATGGGGPSWREDVSEIDEFIADQGVRRVRTRDGKIIEGLDTVIFATGYFYSYPFLDNQAHAFSTSTSNSNSASSMSLGSDSSNCNGMISKKDSPQPDRNLQLTTSGLRTHGVYKHFLYIDNPSLAIPVLNLKAIPFPLAQNQAAVLARLWSGRLTVPARDQMRHWESEEEKRLLEANRVRPAPTSSATAPVEQCEGGFHNLVYPEDVAQINELYYWSLEAEQRTDLENNGQGKLGAYRDEESTWLRSRFPDIKAAYAKHGQDRVQVKSLDMLGDEWENAFDKWSASTDPEEMKDLFKRARVRGHG